MALKPCRECGAQVSTEAEVCPHCGVRAPTADPLAGQAKPRVPKKSLPWAGGIVAAIVLFWFFGGFLWIMRLSGVDTESMLSNDIPKCNSLTATSLAKQALETMPLSKVLNIIVFEIRDAQELTYQSVAKKRLCRATAFLNSGKREVQYSIEWFDEKNRKVFVQITYLGT
jgi:hypothetical protein